MLLCLQRNLARGCATSPRPWESQSAAQRIVSDLVVAGYVSREREEAESLPARRTAHMAHSQHDHEIGELLDLLRMDDSVS